VIFSQNSLLAPSNLQFMNFRSQRWQLSDKEIISKISKPLKETGVHREEASAGKTCLQAGLASRVFYLWSEMVFRRDSWEFVKGTAPGSRGGGIPAGSWGTCRAVGYPKGSGIPEGRRDTRRAVGCLQGSGIPAGQWDTCRVVGYLKGGGIPAGRWNTRREVGYSQGGGMPTGRWDTWREVGYPQGGGIPGGRWDTWREVGYLEGGGIPAGRCDVFRAM